MQQLTICRLGMQLGNGFPATCLALAQFATGLVSPRAEYMLWPEGVGPTYIPAFAKGVTVGGLRFRYSYSINSLLASEGLDNLIDYFQIRSALVVLPLSDSTAQIPGVFPTNLLHYSGTIPESAIGQLGFTRPRVLWRGYDEVGFCGATAVNDHGYCLQHSSDGQPELQVVKSKVSLGHNDCLYWVTEIATGVDFGGDTAIVELDLFGVAAVKPATQTR